MPKDRMNAHECADYLGVCVDTIYRMCRSKEIPHRRVRRKIYFSRASIEAWEIENEKQNYVGWNVG